MTVRNHSNGIGVRYTGAATGNSRPATGAETSHGWMHTADAVQLSRLGNVLNAFQRDAASAQVRMNQLSAAVQRQEYFVSSQVLSERLVLDMFSGQ